MKSESVKSFIDRKIYQSMVDGTAIQSIQSELAVKCKNMINTLLLDKERSKSNYTIENVLNMSISDLDGVVGETRLKYTVYYIKHSKKRIIDLQWLIDNKYKFKQYSNSQIFNLIKLKEKLSNPLYV